jgi:hypothetical protein
MITAHAAPAVALIHLFLFLRRRRPLRLLIADPLKA